MPPVYVIEVSSDGGNTWTTIFDVLKDYPRDAEGNTVKVLTYTKITLDLKPYRSEHMKIRFNCYDTNNEGLQYWWQIDDVEISADAPSAVVNLSADKTAAMPVYNLNGQRIAKPRKGVNIIGGQKILQK